MLACMYPVYTYKGVGSLVGLLVGLVGMKDGRAVGLVGKTVGFREGPDGVRVGATRRALLCGGIGAI